jgi:hypothetical protein
LAALAEHRLGESALAWTDALLAALAVCSRPSPSLLAGDKARTAGHGHQVDHIARVPWDTTRHAIRDPVHRDALPRKAFDFPIVQRRVIERELSLESTGGEAPLSLEQGYRLIEHLLQGHHPHSLGRCGVQQTVWEWDKPFGCMCITSGEQKKAGSPRNT